jgi:hypothetical protein
VGIQGHGRRVGSQVSKPAAAVCCVKLSCIGPKSLDTL